MDVLRRKLLSDEAVLASLDGVWRAQLARLLPELGVGTAGGEPDGQALLFEALACALTEIGQGRPLVAALDDVQWADSTSLDALAYLAWRLPQRGTRVAFLLTARTEALLPPSDLQARLARLGRDLPLCTVELGPLSFAETHAVVGAHTGARDVEEVARWLHGHSQGQPLYLTQALGDLLERGGIDRQAGALVLREGALGGVSRASEP